MKSLIRKIYDEVKELEDFYTLYGGPGHVTVASKDFDYLRESGVLIADKSNDNYARFDGILIRRCKDEDSHVGVVDAFRQRLRGNIRNNATLRDRR